MARADQPLSDAEYPIAVMLERSRDKGAMNLEMLDGFFAALICSPDLVPPSEYLREIWGGGHIGDFRMRPKCRSSSTSLCCTGTAWRARSTQVNRSCRFFWRMMLVLRMRMIGRWDLCAG